VSDLAQHLFHDFKSVAVIVTRLGKLFVANDMAGETSLDEFVGVGRANLTGFLAVCLASGAMFDSFISAAGSARTVDGVRIEPTVFAPGRTVTGFT
jgi:hypothetical protein